MTLKSAAAEILGFLMAWGTCTVLLCLPVAAIATIGVVAFDWSATSWTDISSWNSSLAVAFFAVTGVALVITLFLCGGNLMSGESIADKIGRPAVPPSAPPSSKQ